MNYTEIPLIKSDERGTTHDCGALKVVTRKKGTISGDHSHEVEEILYLIQGSIEITVDTETKTLFAPTKITIPPTVYHKVIALTDFIILEQRKR